MVGDPFGEDAILASGIITLPYVPMTVEGEESKRLRLLSQIPTLGEAPQTLYEDSVSSFGVYMLDKRGGLNLSQPIITFSDILVQVVSENYRERVQITQSSWANKLYAFGQDHRIFSISMKMIDTNLSETVFGDELTDKSQWDGNSRREWQQFYSQASIDSCAQNGWLCAFNYHNRLLIGGLMQQSTSMSSEQPHTYDLTVNMYVIHVGRWLGGSQ